jgi:DNA-binding SARP family transcriptional activator
MLRVRVIGGLAIEADGAPLEPPAGTRAAALLGWLALNRGTHKRGELAARFWPEVLESSSRASLRSALWSLRSALGDDGGGWLVTTRESVGLAESVTTDIAEFRSCVEAGELERAVELGEGELLAGLGDDWVFEARDEHRRELCSALAELAVRARKRGELAAAAGLARRRAALEPLSEDALRALMRTLAEAGEGAGALAAYAKLRERFRLELGISPSGETRALREEIRAAVEPAVPSGVLAGGMTSTYPLAGRERELDELLAAWGQARGGRGGVVLISGQAGIGKTRLALELASRAGETGARIASCAGLDLGGAPPFGLWTELLRDLTQGLAEPPPEAAWPAELAPLAPGLERRLGRMPRAAVGAPELERARLFEAVVEMVEWAADDRPLLLLFEDVHIADAASLELAGYLARRARTLPALLVLTRRELPRRPELDALLTRLRARAALGAEVALGPLEDAAVAQLARAAARLEETEVDRVVELAEGNPLLATETARARARGDRQLPQSLREAVRATLAPLRLGAQRLAGLAAAAGRDLERGELERLPLADHATDASEALESGLLVSRGGRVGYGHALLREAVYADLPEPLRAQFHEQIATALSRGRAAEVARHLRLAGRDAEAVRHLAEAAAEARGLAALDEAAGFLEEALRFAPRDAELLLELAEVEAWRGQTDASRAAFDEALACISPRDPVGGARAWLRRGRSFRGALCFPRESQAAYQQALAALDADSEERPEALAGLAWAEAVAGDVSRVDGLLREIHELVGREQPAAGLAIDIGLARGNALIRRGRFADSYPPLIAAGDAARQAGRPDLAYTCWINASSAAACDRDFERALEFADRCRAAMRHAGLAPLEANALSARTHILLRLGQCEEAEVAAGDQLGLAERLDNPSLRATAIHDSGMVSHAAGDHDRAERLLAEGLAGGAAVSRPLARLARAESLARSARPDEAEAELRETALEPVGPSDFPDMLVARLTYVQGLVAAVRGDGALARRRLGEATAGWRRRAEAGHGGDEYMDVMVDLGRPPVAGLVEPKRELARVAAELDALTKRAAT